MESVFSDGFDYESVDYILECDASFDGEKAGLGWLVLDSPVHEPIMEGYLLADINTSVQSEIMAIFVSLEEILDRDPNTSSVIIRTDYQGIVDALRSETEGPDISKITEQLDKIEDWGVECTSRSDVQRSHDLANYPM